MPGGKGSGILDHHRQVRLQSQILTPPCLSPAFAVRGQVAAIGQAYPRQCDVRARRTGKVQALRFGGFLGGNRQYYYKGRTNALSTLKANRAPMQFNRALGNAQA